VKANPSRSRLPRTALSRFYETGCISRLFQQEKTPFRAPLNPKMWNEVAVSDGNVTSASAAKNGLEAFLHNILRFSTETNRSPFRRARQ
jgi:hypothetical protein